MKKSTNELEDEHELEILKAVAQAWHGHSSSSKAAATTTEFDAYRRNFKSKPTRFKLETMKSTKNDCSSGWDFGQSLWDSYEIVSVSKKLESDLVVLDLPCSALDRPSSSGKKRKESKNSLRNLFNRMSSRRYNEDNLPWEKGS